MAELWAVRLDRPLTAAETAALTALLPAQRRERLERMRTDRGRAETLCAYGLLRLALSHRGWRDWPALTETEDGKPCFSALPALCFSLSHTQGAALAGLAAAPIGVDMERRRPMPAQTMARLAGTETEADFFRAWVRREARVKRSGAGLGAGFRTDPPRLPGETVYLLEPFPGYPAAAALTGGAAQPALYRCTASELLAELAAI